MNRLKRLAHAFFAFLVLVSASSMFFAGRAAATNGILDHRSITMSSSQININNVQYAVTFTYGTSGATVGGLVIDFCGSDPLPGDSCAAMTSFDTNINTGSSYGAALLTAQGGVTGWSIDTTAGLSGAHTIVLKRTAAAITGTPTQTLTFGNGTSSGLHNANVSPANTTFYARIYTFNANVSGTWNSTSPGTYTDFGGVALSNTATLLITAKVQETLTLCVYTGSQCSNGTGTGIFLGDSNHILSVSHSYTDVSAHFDASTNAAQGMNIFASGNTLSTTQGYTIAAIGTPSGSSAGAQSSVGNEQFGFCVFTSTGTGQAVTPTAQYGTSGCSSVTSGADVAGTATFVFDTTSTPNMTSLGGMKIASSGGPSTTTQGTLAYLANIAPTTKAGYYTSTQTFIGIGNF